MARSFEVNTDTTFSMVTRPPKRSQSCSNPPSRPRSNALATPVPMANGARAESNPITIKCELFGLPPGPFVKERDEVNQPPALFKAGAWTPLA
jgi:hypothetical protein